MNKMIALMAASALCFFACSNNSTTSATTTGNSVNVSTSPVDISVTETSPITLNVAQNYFTIGSPACARGGTLSISYVDTVHVMLYDSSLFAWRTDDCRAERYTGKSTAIAGAWTFAGIAQIPSDTTVSKNCQQIYASNYNDNLTITVTDTSLVKTYTDNGVCWSIQNESTVRAVVDHDFATSNISITTSGCNTIIVKADSVEAVLSLTKIDQGTEQQHITFAYNNKSCDYTTLGGTTLDSATCMAAWNAYIVDATAPKNFQWTSYVNSNTPAKTAFKTCVAGTAWNYGPLLFKL